MNKVMEAYKHITLYDAINNYMVAYVGPGKLIDLTLKEQMLIFHAKRGLQEFSYDTLKSIKSQELTVPLQFYPPPVCWLGL